MTNNPADVYDTPSKGRFYSPFNLNIDPMKRLLLINFEKDPDIIYRGFEPQVFDDAVNGTGLLVIAYRNDGQVDVYHQPSLRLVHKNFDIVEQGLADMIERPLEDAHFEVTPHGVDLAFSFKDKQGRPIEVRIEENNPKPIKPFDMLAPLGSGTVQPPALPLIFLYDFYFVRRAGTELEIKVDGKTLKPDTLPMPIDFARVFFTRYATDPFVVTWNATHDGPLTPLEPGRAGAYDDQGTIYDLVENDGHFEIAHMRGRDEKHEVTFTFTPPVPDVASLKDGANVKGAFAIACEASTGTVSGVYHVQRHGHHVELMVHPSGGWQSQPQKWSVKLLFRLVPLFRDWPKTYGWTARIDLGTTGAPLMHAAWERKG